VSFVLVTLLIRFLTSLHLAVLCSAIDRTVLAGVSWLARDDLGLSQASSGISAAVV